jgi:hypothetical protein
MGQTSSKTSSSDEVKYDVVFPNQVVWRFSFYGTIVALVISLAAFLWVATNASKWNSAVTSSHQLSSVLPAAAITRAMLSLPNSNVQYPQTMPQTIVQPSSIANNMYQ